MTWYLYNLRSSLEIHYANTFFLLQNNYNSLLMGIETRSVHGKFNFITVKYNGTQHGIYGLLL